MDQCRLDSKGLLRGSYPVKPQFRQLIKFTSPRCFPALSAPLGDKLEKTELTILTFLMVILRNTIGWDVGEAKLSAPLSGARRMHAQVLQRRDAFLEAFLLMDCRCHVTTAQSPESVDLCSVKMLAGCAAEYDTEALAKYAVMDMRGS